MAQYARRRIFYTRLLKKTPMRKVWCLWATTAKFGTHVYVQKLNDGPNIDLARPIATKILDLKNLDFRFFAKMAAKTTSFSNSDRRFRLFGPSFHIWNTFLDVYLQVLASLSDQQFRRSDLVISPTKRQYDEFSQVVRPVILQPCQRRKRNSGMIVALI